MAASSDERVSAGYSATTTARRHEERHFGTVRGRVLSCRQLFDRPHVLSRTQVVGASRLLLVEFITALGSLTGEVLTPALYAESCALRMQAVCAGDARRGAQRPRRGLALPRPKHTGWEIGVAIALA